MHARATATKAVKNNISNTEILAYHNIISGQQQVCIKSIFSILLQPKHKQSSRKCWWKSEF